MGHKVNPVGFRIGINRDWNSRWFANNQDYSTFLLEDLHIRKYLVETLKEALLSHVEIERIKTDKGHAITVLVFVARPGVVIGQDGANINKIKKELAKLVTTGTLRVDVIEVKSPDLDANLVAQSIATQLEERASFRTVQKKAIQRVRKAGAKGCKTLVSGRLAGAEIARKEGYKDGSIPLHTLRSDIDYAAAEARTTYGRLGVKVWICRGDILPAKKAVVVAPVENKGV
ncbi:MAG: 30S ribosomal protein S3 [Firmicutes bacterium]|nr:30S ribosomal protein S3 [Bacillota bacterium]